ncbi:MAG: hypothetical protein ACW967_06415 [Candidatus Hodarchaeales archaeon]|jgi:hypothetical protein
MSRSRPKRRVAPRRSPVKPREEVQVVPEETTARNILEKFQKLSANTQIYYTKIIVSFVLAIPSGAIFTNPDIASNWFLIPILGLGLAMLIVRFALKIDVDQASWPRLILSGTITLFISYIVISSLVWMLFFANLPQYLILD